MSAHPRSFNREHSYQTFSFTYMAFRVYKGKTKVEWLPVTTSTAMVKGDAVEFTSGLIGLADADDTVLAGVIQKTIASTDSDYATARKVPIKVPVERHVVWECEDLSGTFSASDIGGEYGLTDQNTLDQTETTAKVFLVTEFVSTTKVRGYFKINGAY